MKRPFHSDLTSACQNATHAPPFDSDETGWLAELKKIGNMSDLIRRVFWEETGVILVEAEGNKSWPSRGRR
jgi:hypothetical protein